MDFEKIVMSRYATKKFDGKKIDQSKVDKLLELIRYAPSSYNLQPWTIYVVTDQETKDAIQKASWNQPQVSTSSHLLIFCANTDMVSHINLLEEQMKAVGASTNYITVMREFESKMSPDQKKSWAQRQVYLALGNALNGAKSLGFDSCPMEGFNHEEVGKILKVPSHVVVTALCPIGYAADTPRQKMRFDRKKVFIE